MTALDHSICTFYCEHSTTGCNASREYRAAVRPCDNCDSTAFPVVEYGDGSRICSACDLPVLGGVQS